MFEKTFVVWNAFILTLLVHTRVHGHQSLVRLDDKLYFPNLVLDLRTKFATCMNETAMSFRTVLVYLWQVCEMFCFVDTFQTKTKVQKVPKIIKVR